MLESGVRGFAGAAYEEDMMAVSAVSALVRARLLLLVFFLLMAPALGPPAVGHPLQAAPAAAPTAQDWAAIRTLLPIDQQAYVKASQVSSNDGFGGRVAAAGNTVVVGVVGEDSSTVGVQNSATPTIDEAGTDAGAAYVFVRAGTTWRQQAYLKASQVSVGDRFGVSVAISGDTIVVGASAEDSSTAGVQNTATPTVDEQRLNAGAAYVFVREGTTWHQQAYLKASQVSDLDQFGVGVAVSGDTIVVGASGEASSTAGVQNSAMPTVDEHSPSAGAAFIFTRTGAQWRQQAYLKASQVSANDSYGYQVAVDGATVVVGAFWEDSSTVGVQNSATPTVDEAATDAGAAYVYTRMGTTWSQQAYLKASQVTSSDHFSYGVAVSGDTIVIGAPREDSSTVGVQHGATPTVDEMATDAGAVYVFVRTGTMWGQQAYLKASQVTSSDQFGWSMAVHGATLVVGGVHEDSSLAGVQNSATPTVDEAALNAGAAYVFVQGGTMWQQQAYLKASQVTAGDLFGMGVAITREIIVVGASNEDSSTVGVQHGSAPTVDEAVSNAGAAYVYGTGAPPLGEAVYLPVLMAFQPRLLSTINATVIPEQPVTVPGMAFYTTTITLPNALPAGGTLYLSGSPTSLTPGLVDDGLIMRVGGTEIFRHDYGATSRPTPALVPVPRSVLDPWAGQAIAVQFVDFHGSVTQASPLYLVWQP